MLPNSSVCALETLTAASGFPCEKPVPTGCSTKRMLDRFVQLNSFCVGCACPQDHENGYEC